MNATRRPSAPPRGLDADRWRAAFDFYAELLNSGETWDRFCEADDQWHRDHHDGALCARNDPYLPLMEPEEAATRLLRRAEDGERFRFDCVQQRR